MKGEPYCIHCIQEGILFSLLYMPLKAIKGKMIILLIAEDSLAVLNKAPRKKPIPLPAKPTIMDAHTKYKIFLRKMMNCEKEAYMPIIQYMPEE